MGNVRLSFSLLVDVAQDRVPARVIGAYFLDRPPARHFAEEYLKATTTSIAEAYARPGALWHDTLSRNVCRRGRK